MFVGGVWVFCGLGLGFFLFLSFVFLRSASGASGADEWLGGYFRNVPVSAAWAGAPSPLSRAVYPPERQPPTLLLPRLVAARAAAEHRSLPPGKSEVKCHPSRLSLSFKTRSRADERSWVGRGRRIPPHTRRHRFARCAPAPLPSLPPHKLRCELLSVKRCCSAPRTQVGIPIIVRLAQ